MALCSFWGCVVLVVDFRWSVKISLRMGIPEEQAVVGAGSTREYIHYIPQQPPMNINTHVHT